MDSPSSQPKNLTIPLNAPLAIIVAGALIAAALYFKPGAGGTAAGTNLGAGDPAPAPAAPAAPVVGEVRAVDPARDHIRGAQNAKVTIIEYSDLECPFCKRFHPTMQQVMREYPNDVRWVYRHFPLETLHQQAKAESNAAECAGEQGKFWEFIDKLYAVTPSNDGLDLTQLPTYAREVGVVNIPQFEACVASNQYADRVQADYDDAGVAGGTGTPYSVVMGPDGQKVPIEGAQPYASVKAAIDSLL